MCHLREVGSLECTEELHALAYGSHINANYYTSCVVNGVRFVTHTRDVRRTTQNSGIAVPGEDGSTFYGQLEDIVELRYLHGNSVVLFRCKWFNTNRRQGRCVTKNNITSINVSSESFRDDQFILATQAKQVFYIEDPSQNRHWRVVEDVNHRKIWDLPTTTDVNEIDVVHNTNSSNLVLTVDLGELPYVSSERVGQSNMVDDIPTTDPTLEDDNIISDEDEDEEVDLDEDGLDDVDGDCVVEYCSSDGPD